jgi:ABC-type branched-subunit amino acid transport system ATPase component
MTLGLVSQETMQCLQLAERAQVLENGRVALEGKCSTLLAINRFTYAAKSS